MVTGGPTTVLDLGGLRIVSDPTFDAPGPHGYLTKTVGPAVAEDQLGPVDLVLVSHEPPDTWRPSPRPGPRRRWCDTRGGAVRWPAAAGLPVDVRTVRRPVGGDRS